MRSSLLRLPSDSRHASGTLTPAHIFAKHEAGSSPICANLRRTKCPRSMKICEIPASSCSQGFYETTAAAPHLGYHSHESAKQVVSLETCRKPVSAALALLLTQILEQRLTRPQQQSPRWRDLCWSSPPGVHKSLQSPMQQTDKADPAHIDAATQYPYREFDDIRCSIVL